MRVITGSARGKRLETLDGIDVRPTADRVKEAVFSIIQFRTEGRRFLDLFAGSGQMGIEALSRGAAEAVFVDQNRRSAEVARRNIEATGFNDRAKLVRTDAQTFLRTDKSMFDIAFLDPPYSSQLIEECLPALAQRMNPGGIIICETTLDRVLPQSAGDFEINREYRYGKIKITTYAILNEKEREN